MKSKLILFCIVCSSSLFSKTMLEYYDIALEQSAIVKESKYSLEATQHNIDKVSSKNGININWSISGTRINDESDVEADDNTYNQRNYNISLSKPLYSIDNNLAVSKAQIEADIEALKYQKSLQNFSNDFLEKYLAIYKEKKFYEFALRHKIFATKLFQKATKLYEFSRVSKSDFLKVEANLIEAKENLMLSKLRYEKSKSIFQLLLNTPHIDKLSDFSLDSLEFLSLDYNNDLENNFDLQVVKLEIESIRQDVDAFKKWYYPTLNFNLNYSDTQTGDPTTNDIAQTSGKLTLSGKIYQGGYTSSSKEQSLALLQAKKSNRSFLEHKVNIRINENIIELNNNIAQFKIIKQKLLQANSELKSIQRQNQMGLIDFSKMLEMQNNIYKLQAQSIEKTINSLKLFATIKYDTSLKSKEVIVELNQLLQ